MSRKRRKSGPSIVIYGAGGHGKVVADIIEKAGGFALAGFVDDSAGGSVAGYPVLGDKARLHAIRASGVEFAISAVGNADAREKLDLRLLEAGFKLVVLVHPSAQVAKGAILGDGTVVMPGAVIGPDTKVGRSCIINTSASIDHDCEIGDYTHVAPGCTLCGGVKVGAYTLVGAGATVIPGIRLGNRCTVGAGAVVVKNVADSMTVVGVPARPMR